MENVKEQNDLIPTQFKKKKSCPLKTKKNNNKEQTTNGAVWYSSSL